jgi:hypothetical protein
MTATAFVISIGKNALQQRQQYGFAQHFIYDGSYTYCSPRFISTRAVSIFPSSSRHHHGSLAMTATGTASQQLYRGAGLVKDYSNDAIKFFTEIRNPAAFLLGTSLALVFAMTNRAKDSELKRNSPLKNAILLLYHVMSLQSFLLSLNVVLSSTAASITLLMGVENPLARSTYELLYRELNFEFLMTRFCFFLSMYTFLGAITLRSLIDFELLSKKRIRSTLMLLLSIASLAFHWTSNVNQSLYSCPNLFHMSILVVKSFFQRAFTAGRICETLSFACFFGAMLLLGQLVLRIVQFSEEEKEEDDSSKSLTLPVNETATA